MIGYHHYIAGSGGPNEPPLMGKRPFYAIKCENGQLMIKVRLHVINDYIWINVNPNNIEVLNDNKETIA